MVHTFKGVCTSLNWNFSANGPKYPFNDSGSTEVKNKAEFIHHVDTDQHTCYVYFIHFLSTGGFNAIIHDFTMTSLGNNGIINDE